MGFQWQYSTQRILFSTLKLIASWLILKSLPSFFYLRNFSILTNVNAKPMASAWPGIYPMSAPAQLQPSFPKHFFPNSLFCFGFAGFCAIFPTFLFLNTKPAYGMHNFSDVVLESFLELIIYAPWEGLQDWPTPEARVGEFQQRYQQRSTATWLAWRAAGEAAQGVRSQQLCSAQATLTVPTVPIKAELSITKQDQPAF